ncbi:ABC-type glutathione transport system ATPase component [Pararhizobium capsulatum DSM 1112]|uniref:ABC-type glutathione transport system ATPase component n=1 Tax=Pararhizobium capsulatum DSM 1112 TaxID=1121113 RepID=A0ABU0BYC1_9HYPH|nr:ABC transporter ATP-binding protein [Pararhizobium capsulatum]MDQ0323254.1 ABC-type glutathione transport system ATPase component [Pararhizobium capsulatum DSM 1112]
MSTTPLLVVKNLSVTFGRQAPSTVVSGLGFEVMRGEAVAIVGESGSGKSVTALSIMGLLPEASANISSGEITFEGCDLLRLEPNQRRALRGLKIGMIFQEPTTSLNPVLTIGRQMTEALQQHLGINRHEADGRAIDMLDRVGIKSARQQLPRYPHEFSGGMRQRVMIAAAMMMQPRLLIADEPTTALDVTAQAQVMRLMRELVSESGASLLLITHDMGVVAENADRVVVMKRGVGVETAPAGSLFANPGCDYTRRLLAAVPNVLDKTTRLDFRHSPKTALKLTRITKSFGSNGWFSPRRSPKVLDDVSLTIAKGETLALVGESGSGKSTLGRIACRLLASDFGEVEVDGETITHLGGSSLRNARSRIQMIFQDPYASLDPRRTIGQTLAEPLAIQGRLGTQEIDVEVGRLLDLVQLGSSVTGRFPHQFSGGQRQRIAIARALAVNPSVIVADEPTSALDVSIQAGILDLLGDIQRENNLALLFITHDLAVVRKIAHRVAVMRTGRIVELGTTGHVLDAPAHAYTRLLLSSVPVPDPAFRGKRLAMPDGELDMPIGSLRMVASGHWVAS